MTKASSHYMYVQFIRNISYICTCVYRLIRELCNLVLYIKWMRVVSSVHIFDAHVI
jgi:hypothetical protein